ncbi:hypothetical protein AGMMS49593_10440 [Endomicrobiia bacterium]|nr:hypothetical protein AGMMS49593_10440 [Endomicrobiia bacterium]
MEGVGVGAAGRGAAGGVGGDADGVEEGAVARSDADNFGDDTFCRFGGGEGDLGSEGINNSGFAGVESGKVDLASGFGGAAGGVGGADESFVGGIGVCLLGDGDGGVVVGINESKGAVGIAVALGFSSGAVAVAAGGGGGIGGVVGVFEVGVVGFGGF